MAIVLAIAVVVVVTAAVAKALPDCYSQVIAPPRSSNHPTPLEIIVIYLYPFKNF